MTPFELSVIFFIVALFVSTIIIYLITTIFGEKKGIGTALFAALIGSVIYALAYYFMGNGILAAVLGGIAWLIALGSLYNTGWLKSAGIAVVIWVVAFFVGFILPTVTGPL
jgi:hypothetical protein